jgi:hypothetical protein
MSLPAPPCCAGPRRCQGAMALTAAAVRHQITAAGTASRERLTTKQDQQAGETESLPNPGRCRAPSAYPLTGQHPSRPPPPPDHDRPGSIPPIAAAEPGHASLRAPQIGPICTSRSPQFGARQAVHTAGAISSSVAPRNPSLTVTAAVRFPPNRGGLPMLPPL